MGFFGRDRSGRGNNASNTSAAELWSWWDTVRGEVAAAIAEGTVTRFVDDVSTRVHAIHPDLAWEFSKGSAAEHAFVISSEGIAEMRATAERVIRLAPPSDPIWEYASSRQADPEVDSAVLEFGAVAIDLGSIRFAATHDEDRAELDVLVYHPDFHRLEDGGTRAAFLVVDWAIGEDAVERWIGSLGVAFDPPDESDGLTVAQLRDEAARLAATTEPFWVVLEWDEEELVAVARRPLKCVEFPTFDLRIDVTMVLSSRESVGIAQAVDDRILELLGETGMHAASVTQHGRRTSMFYGDSEAISIENLEAGARQHVTESFAFDAQLDPGWEAVRKYR